MMRRLPDEIILAIFEHLTPSERAAIESVSRHWKLLLDSPILWKTVKATIDLSSRACWKEIEYALSKTHETTALSITIFDSNKEVCVDTPHKLTIAANVAAITITETAFTSWLLSMTSVTWSHPSPTLTWNSAHPIVSTNPFIKAMQGGHVKGALDIRCKKIAQFAT